MNKSTIAALILSPLAAQAHHSELQQACFAQGDIAEVVFVGAQIGIDKNDFIAEALTVPTKERGIIQGIIEMAYAQERLDDFDEQRIWFVNYILQACYDETGLLIEGE